jgi:hypothetical protein
MQVGVDAILDCLNRDMQMNQGVQFKAAGLNNGNHAAGTGQTVDRQNSQRWRTIEKDDRILRQRRPLQTGFEEKLPPRLGEKLGLGTAKLNRGGRQAKVL